MPAPTYAPVFRARRGKGPRTKKAARRLANRRADLTTEWYDEQASLFGIVAESEHDYYRRRTDG